MDLYLIDSHTLTVTRGAVKSRGDTVGQNSPTPVREGCDNVVENIQVVVEGNEIRIQGDLAMAFSVSINGVSVSACVCVGCVWCNVCACVCVCQCACVRVLFACLLVYLFVVLLVCCLHACFFVVCVRTVNS